MRWMHVYAQGFHHEPVLIAGDREALTALRAAVDMALANKAARSDPVFTGDGEGYAVRVMVAGYPTIERLRLPYTDKEIAGDSDGECPEELFRGMP